MTEYVLVDEESREPVPDLESYDNRFEAEDVAAELTQNTAKGVSFRVEKVEQDDETTDDNNTSMSEYTFIGAKAQNENTEEEQFNTVGSMWNLGDHSTASSTDRDSLTESINNTIEALDDDIDGDMKEVLQDASRLVQNTRVVNFECPVEECGLGHTHSDHKHDIRQSFDVLDSFASQMAFCPYCHCGVNELSMLMAFFPYISEPVFADQYEFEEVLEVEPDVLEEMYRLYVGEDMTVNQAAGRVAADRGISEVEVVPLGTRDAIKTFFRRRRDIEDAADSAPIAQETRQAIEQNRRSLETVVSQ